jgi:hypothetical protein
MTTETIALAGLLTTLSVEDATALIASIDLSMVKLKLMDEDEGEGWDQEHVNFVETRYRRFLCMMKLCPDGPSVPTRDIDKFWHQHILDTRAYARDCERVFGHFIHHFPYFGMRGDEDAQNLSDSFELTKAIHASLFGEPYCPDDVAMNCHKGCNRCHSCKSGCGMKCHQCKKG